MDEYDNGNNDWIAMNGNPKEWAVAYHGTCERAVKPIVSKQGKFLIHLKKVQQDKNVKIIQILILFQKNNIQYVVKVLIARLI